MPLPYLTDPSFIPMQPGRPSRDRMQCARHDFFSRAVLPCNEHVRIRRADAGDGLENRVHGRGRGYELGAPLSL